MPAAGALARQAADTPRHPRNRHQNARFRDAGMADPSIDPRPHWVGQREPKIITSEL